MNDASTEKNPENVTFIAFKFFEPQKFVCKQKDNKNLYFMLT